MQKPAFTAKTVMEDNFFGAHSKYESGSFFCIFHTIVLQHTTTAVDDDDIAANVANILWREGHTPKTPESETETQNGKQSAPNEERAHPKPFYSLDL